MRLKKCVLFFLLTACGTGVVASDTKVPISTLKGRISRADVAPTDHTRAAIVWYRFADQGPAMIATDVGSVADVGVSFTLSIVELPPATVLESCGNGCERALGELVIYDDQNQNSRLDLVPYEAPTAPDLVVGVLKLQPHVGSYSLFYLAGTPGEENKAWHGAPQGFSWVDYSSNPLAFLPPNTEVELELGATPSAQAYMCESYPEARMEEPTNDAPTVHEIYPDFDRAVDLKCRNGGLFWMAFIPWESRSACLPEGSELLVLSSNVWSKSDGIPPPADWPCELTEAP